MKFIPSLNVKAVETQKVCELPAYTPVKLVDVPAGDLTEDQLMELFLKGNLDGVETTKQYIAA